MGNKRNNNIGDKAGIWRDLAIRHGFVAVPVRPVSSWACLWEYLSALWLLARTTQPPGLPLMATLTFRFQIYTAFVHVYLNIGCVNTDNLYACYKFIVDIRTQGTMRNRCNFMRPDENKEINWPHATSVHNSSSSLSDQSLIQSHNSGHRINNDIK
jgi:hypothetical protein